MNQNGNATVHIEPVIVTEGDFEPDETQTNSEEARALANTSVETEFYKRVGFYCAFNKEPEKEFRRSLINLEDSIQSKIDRLHKEFTHDITRFDERKDEAATKVDEIKDDLNRYESELSKLETDLPTLQKQFESLRKELRKIVISIGEKKENLIRDRQNALLQELNWINEELEQVIKKRMGINEEIFLKEKEVLDVKRRFWQELFEKYERNHKEVLNKLRLYGLSGFHFISSSFLYNVGLISSGVAGAFFASFTEINQFTSGGVLSFGIQSLFAFSMQFIGQDSEIVLLGPSKKYVFAGILLLIFLGSIAVVFLASWVCQTAYSKVFEKNLSEKEKPFAAPPSGDESEFSGSIELNLESQSLPIKTKISERSFFGFWLKVTPLVVFLSILFVFLSLGTDPESLKSLDSSIAGYGIGLLLSLASAGVLYIYLTMVIEPRIEKQKEIRDGNDEVGWRWTNIELVLLTSAFIGSIVVILVFFQHPFAQLFQTKSMVSLLLFLVCSLLTAFTLGFGIRFQSLELAREYLESNCDLIQTKIIRISRPLQIYLTKRENTQFNAKYIQIRNEIMNLILSRTRLTRNAINTPLMMDKRQFRTGRLISSFNRWIRDKLSQNKTRVENGDEGPAINGHGPEIEQDILTTSAETRILFPILEAELSAVEAEAKEVFAKVDMTQKEIIFRKEQKGDFYDRKLRELAEQELRYRNYHKAITNREKEFNHKRNAQTKRNELFSQRIIEGYELGHWFAKNNATGTQIPEVIPETQLPKK